MQFRSALVLVGYACGAFGCAAGVGGEPQGSEPGEGGASGGGGARPPTGPGRGGAGGGASGDGPSGGGGAVAADGSAPGGDGGSPPVAPAAPRVAISEIMYHPVLEDTAEELHEFIELYNQGSAAVSLAGWKLAGPVTFTFPAGASLAPKAFVVIAKNRQKLAEVAKYGLRAADLQGDYAGELDNGGGRLALLDAAGNTVDVVAYNDKFPWPIAADALGAGESWLPMALVPLKNHQYLGHSLERVSYDIPATEVANWVPSRLDGATPGKANSVSGTPPPIVQMLSAVSDADGQPLIKPSDKVKIRAKFSPFGMVRDVKLEYFVDDVAVANEPYQSLAMTAGADGFEAVLPAQAANAIVRYRIAADRGAGREVISPRPTDPFAAHAYFVDPGVDTTSRLYHLFIAPADWGRLWTNIQAGRATGCTVNDLWDARVPAVFVFNGKVYDVRIRYQGSRWGRKGGRTISTWPYPRPTAGPNPLLVLSYNVSFPRYREFEGRRKVLLNKNIAACPGMAAYVGWKLMEAAGIPAPAVRFARVHINGGYYHYMLDMEQFDESLLRRFYGASAPVGDHFKSVGCTCDEGPWGWGDQRKLTPTCNFTLDQRYAATYERKSNDWKVGSSQVSALVDELHTARAAGPTALRDFFTKRFDLEKLIAFRAIRNWMAPGDDWFQNHFLNQRPDGKWLLMPWDFDDDLGGWSTAPAAGSFYIGEQGDPNNRSAWWNYITDAFFKTYRTEFNQKLVELDGTILEPNAVKKLVDEILAMFNRAEATRAPAGIACDPTLLATRTKKFIDDRHAALVARFKK